MSKAETKLFCEPFEVIEGIAQILKTITPIGLNLFFYNLWLHYAAQKSNSFYKIFIYEIVIIVLPVILLVTIANELSGIATVLYIIATIIFFINKTKKSTNFKFSEYSLSISWARSCVFIITAVTILAVDFKYFPGSAMKTDFTGISLMDTGIGYFIFCIGIVNKIHNLEKSTRKALFLIFLGIFRTFVVQILSYHQPELEYGRHWNAFFTIGFTQLFGNFIIYSLKKKSLIAMFGIFLAIVHEIVLQNFLFVYVMSETSPRDNLVSANREGIVSLIGFISFYLLCTSASFEINELKRKGSQSIFYFLSRVVLIAFISFIILIALIFNNTCNIARRIANLQYVLFMVFLCAFTLLLTITVEYLSNGLKINLKNQILFNIINFKGLQFFIVTNIFTGSANLFVDLHRYDKLEMILILIVYMILSCLVTKSWGGSNKTSLTKEKLKTKTN